MSALLPPVTLVLAAPRGFCAGVDRAIQIVEKALQKFGAPVYVRHEIVHNRYVVENLQARGAVFVEELDEVPDDGQPVVFSAHGVPKSVPAAARTRKLFYLDATCPLVSKVHRGAESWHKKGYHVFLIGHAGHPEVIGTLGQLPADAMTLVEDEAAARRVVPPEGMPLAYATQTTLSLDETKGIIDVLRQRFPLLEAPKKDDICYATTNRQLAVRQIAPTVDAMLVIGAPNSSNSKRLVDVAREYGCPQAVLIQRAGDIDWSSLSVAASVGITAGASAPEVLVEEVLAAFRQRRAVTVQERHIVEETVVFQVPKSLMDDSVSAQPFG